MEEPTWSSGPLPLLQAVRVWCAGAGVAGAYWPGILDRLAAYICCEQITLAQLVAETCRRIDWIVDFDEPAGCPRPRSPDYSPSRSTLEWRTSVTVRLAPLGAEWRQWEVTLLGEHDDRRSVMEHAIHRLAEEETDEKK